MDIARAAHIILGQANHEIFPVRKILRKTFKDFSLCIIHLEKCFLVTQSLQGSYTSPTPFVNVYPAVDHIPSFHNSPDNIPRAGQWHIFRMWLAILVNIVC